MSVLLIPRPSPLLRQLVELLDGLEGPGEVAYLDHAGVEAAGRFDAPTLNDGRVELGGLGQAGDGGHDQGLGPGVRPGLADGLGDVVLRRSGEDPFEDLVELGWVAWRLCARVTFGFPGT